MGAGGCHLGFKNAGFTTVDAVDLDMHAIATLKKNCPGVSTFQGDIRDYLKQHQDPQIRKLQGRVDCIVVTATALNNIEYKKMNIYFCATYIFFFKSRKEFKQF